MSGWLHELNGANSEANRGEICPPIPPLAVQCGRQSDLAQVIGRRRCTLAVACAVLALVTGVGVAATPAGQLTNLPGTAACLTTDTQPGCGRATGVDAATRVVISPDGRSVYVAGLASLAVFSRTGTTGALQQAAGTAGCIQDPAPTWHAHRNCQPVAGLWPVALAVSPDGKNVYVASAVDDRAHGGPFSSFVAVFSRDTGTGLLREQTAACVGRSDSRRCAAARSLSGPSSIAVSPDGRNVYLGSDGGIAVFRRNSDGSLLQLAGGSGCVLAAGKPSCSPRPASTGGTEALGVSADGTSVYAVVGRGSSSDANLLLAFRRDRGTGALTQLPGSAGCLGAAARAGCRAATGLTGAPWEFSIALSPDGKSLYLSSGDGLASFARRVSDGRLDQLPGTASCLGSADWKSACTNREDVQPYTGVAVNRDGANVYLALQSGPQGAGGSLVTFTRDRATGALAFDGCAAETGPRCGRARALGEVSDIALSPDNHNLYAVGLHGAYPASARILAFKRS